MFPRVTLRFGSVKLVTCAEVKGLSSLKLEFRVSPALRFVWEKKENKAIPIISPPPKKDIFTTVMSF